MRRFFTGILVLAVIILSSCSDISEMFDSVAVADSRSWESNLNLIMKTEVMKKMCDQGLKLISYEAVSEIDGISVMGNT